MAYQLNDKKQMTLEKFCNKIIVHYETEKIYRTDPFLECYQLAKEVLNQLNLTQQKKENTMIEVNTPILHLTYELLTDDQICYEIYFETKQTEIGIAKISIDYPIVQRQSKENIFILKIWIGEERKIFLATDLKNVLETYEIHLKDFIEELIQERKKTDA